MDVARRMRRGVGPAAGFRPKGPSVGREKGPAVAWPYSLARAFVAPCVCIHVCQFTIVSDYYIVICSIRRVHFGWGRAPRLNQTRKGLKGRGLGWVFG